MQHLLLQWNIDFDIVSNGLEAIEQLSAQTYDLVLMDIQMPKMDGYAATQHIRDVLKSDIPIIAMTAHAMAGEREKCLSRGMNEYLSKPINEEKLFKFISEFGLENAQQKEKKAVEITIRFQYLDLTYMRSISGGDTDFEKTVTQQFIDNVPLHLQELLSAYQSHDFVTVNHRAHDLKTSVAMMGLLTVLEEKLDVLEVAAEQKASLQQVLEDLKSILTIAVAEAKNFLQQL
jgi:CheY-like chemotaxis protein